MQYLFELGRISELSRAEIEHVFLALQISYTIKIFEKNILIVETPESIDLPKIMDRLGGTIKVAEFVSEKNSIEAVGNYLNENQEGKIQFSLSGNNAKDIALQVKKYLKELGRSVRYIEAKNTATILHNNLVEKNGDLTLTKYGVFVTRDIQPIEEWGERDFGRPGRDSRSGMLPPKLARILINLTGTDTANTTILDPFCGSGTVLTEAMSLGYQKIIGSDTSEKALDDTRKNIDWMKSQIIDTQPALPKLILASATELHGKLPPASVDAIAAEPYMGRPLRGTEDKHTLTKQANELKELYVQAFQSFHKILKSGASVVFIIPRFSHGQEWIRINCTEEIQTLGFSLERLTSTEPWILYSRPGQFVGREIWKFKKI